MSSQAGLTVQHVEMRGATGIANELAMPSFLALHRSFGLIGAQGRVDSSFPDTGAASGTVLPIGGPGVARDQIRGPSQSPVGARGDRP